MQQIELPSKSPVLSGKGWTAFIVALLVVCTVAPTLNLLVPQTSLFHMSDYAVALVGKIMCYAICALAMDLIWGYTGILSLGARPVLRPGRLCDGHVPDAPDWHGWQLQKRAA